MAVSVWELAETDMNKAIKGRYNFLANNNGTLYDKANLRINSTNFICSFNCKSNTNDQKQQNHFSFFYREGYMKGSALSLNRFIGNRTACIFNDLF